MFFIRKIRKIDGTLFRFMIEHSEMKKFLNSSGGNHGRESWKFIATYRCKESKNTYLVCRDRVSRYNPGFGSAIKHAIGYSSSSSTPAVSQGYSVTCCLA